MYWQQDVLTDGQVPLYEIDGSDGVAYIWATDGLVRCLKKQIYVPIHNLTTRQIEDIKTSMEELFIDNKDVKYVQLHYKSNPQLVGFLAIRSHTK